MASQSNDWLTTKEAASLLRCSPWKALKLSREGKIYAKQTGDGHNSRYIFSAVSMKKYLEEVQP